MVQSDVEMSPKRRQGTAHSGPKFLAQERKIYIIILGNRSNIALTPMTVMTPVNLKRPVTPSWASYFDKWDKILYYVCALPWPSTSIPSWLSQIEAKLEAGLEDIETDVRLNVFDREELRLNLFREAFEETALELKVNC
jgi:hypothetical protein